MVGNDVSISVEAVDGDGAVDTVENLDAWLRGEPEFSGRVRLEHAAPRPGEMGSITDALIVAVGAHGALTALAGSLRSWFAQPRRSDVRIKITAADGSSLELDAERVRNPELEALLARSLDARAPGARTPEARTALPESVGGGEHTP